MPTPRYIAELRQLWGHRPLLLPGVSGVVLRDEGGQEQVLLVRRADTGRWSVPAGIVEPGEQPADCVVREIWEETRVRVVVERLVSVIAEDELVYPNKDRCQFISMTFRCHRVGGQASIGDEESLAVEWFPVDALPELGDRERARIAAARSPDPACGFLVDGAVQPRR